MAQLPRPKIALYLNEISPEEGENQAKFPAQFALEVKEAGAASDWSHSIQPTGVEKQSCREGFPL